jgi:hypothetical protein
MIVAAYEDPSHTRTEPGYEGLRAGGSDLPI